MNVVKSYSWLFLLSVGFAPASFAQTQASTHGSWTFAVSGDSRNCGDVVMPSIASKVHSDKAEFYWHLGDYRALYDFDQDLLAAKHQKLTISNYESVAWPDFIDQQLKPFGGTPVFLAIGNHELISRSRSDVLVQFADWFGSPAIKSQRTADDPSDHTLRTYYHWQQGNVDFITLDNASAEEFDRGQLAWFEKVLKRDAADPHIRTVVLGMHEALPDSLSAGHSMNESAEETATGRQVYNDLVRFRRATGKEVLVLASHSHFLMSDIYNTGCHQPDEVLPGWIVGTAGAVRYHLPADHSVAKVARTDVYGYLLGTVSPEGHITFSFREVTEADVSPETVARYGKDQVHQCFAGNQNDYVPESPVCPLK